ncbi:hypothetical protein MMC29_005408 [Sticta canariensis]|nr:hypothetical protein [Sticta canariensis]
MASHYLSDHSSSSAQSTEHAGTGNPPRPRPRSSNDRFIVSQNRTRVPSAYRPLDQSAGLPTAVALLAAESRTSSTHDAEEPFNYSPSTNVGPALPVSRDAGDRTTLRTYRNGIRGRTIKVDAGGEDRSYRKSRRTRLNEDLVATELGTSSTYHTEGRPIHYSSSGNVRPAPSASRDAGDRPTSRTYRDQVAIPSNVKTRPEARDYRPRVASEISPTFQNLTDTFDSLASESSVSDGRCRAVSSGSITTSNRDFSSSSSSSHGALGPAQALEQFNMYAREQGLTLIEDEETDEETASPIEAPLSQNRAVRFLKKSGSRTQMALATVTKALKRTASKPNLQRENLQKESLRGKTIEELGMVGVSGMYLPAEFAVGGLVVPTFLANLMIYIDSSVDKRKIFGASGPESVVNELYNYFASQFPRADDQRTYDQGAASTLLPQHFEYGVIDVAQVLKKITHGLKCGLLGSVSLFEAFASIHEKFKNADAAGRLVQAKLMALAISSVPSIRRKSYIIALLGLSSMIGHDALNASNHDELMTFQKLGVVLGPCLLGVKKSEEIKTEKVKPDGQLMSENQIMVAQFEVAQRVAEMLTSMWKEIVRQLRLIEHREDLRVRRNVRPATEQGYLAARLSKVLEDAQAEDDSRTTAERPLQHGNRVDRRIVNSSQGAHFSQSEGGSSAESSVRRHPGSNIGDRQLFETPLRHDLEGRFERPRHDRGFSAPRNEPNVRSGNVSSSQATSSSPSEGYSSAESSVRRRTGSNVGHRGRLPDVSPPSVQARSDQGRARRQDTSAWRKEPNVRAGNNPGPVSRSKARGRDQFDGQYEEDVGSDQPFSAATHESWFRLNKRTRLEENAGHQHARQPLPTPRNYSWPLGFD